MKEKKHLAVNAMVEEWEAKIARLKADLAAMTSRYSRAAADIASFEDEVTGSKERINQLYASHYQKRAEITRLTAELAEAKKDNAALREDKERLDLLEEWWEMSGKNTSGERIYTVRSHTTQATDASLRGAIDMIRAALDDAKQQEPLIKEEE